MACQGIEIEGILVVPPGRVTPLLVATHSGVMKSVHTQPDSGTPKSFQFIFDLICEGGLPGCCHTVDRDTQWVTGSLSV